MKVGTKRKERRKEKKEEKNIDYRVGRRAGGRLCLKENYVLLVDHVLSHKYKGGRLFPPTF